MAHRMSVTATGPRRSVLPLEGALVFMGGSGASGGQWVAATWHGPLAVTPIQQAKYYFCVYVVSICTSW